MKKARILVLIGVLMLTLCAGALAQGTVTATGSGKVQLIPDIATINLGVTATNADVGRAMAEVNERLDAVRQSLKDNGVQAGDIAVNDIYMYTQYDYSTGDEQIVGYTVSHQLSVKARDTALLGKLIDDALAAGANQLNGVAFQASKSDEAYLEALKLAVESAHARAEAMAEARGLKLGALSALKEEAEGYSAITAKAASFDGAGAGTQVDVGSLTVSASVSAVFEVE